MPAVFIIGKQIGFGPVVADWFDRIIFSCFLLSLLSFSPSLLANSYFVLSLHWTVFQFFQIIAHMCQKHHTLISARLTFVDAWCPTECRATGALSGSDVRSRKQPKTRSLGAAPVPGLLILSANAFVSQGQCEAFRLSLVPRDSDYNII